MSQLIQLLYRGRNLFLFIILELLSFWLMVKNNNYWSVSFFNSTNYYAAKVLEANKNLTDYLSLKSKNQDLANENQKLRQELVKYQQLDQNPLGIYHPDSIFASRFEFKVAKVIKNSSHLPNNYLTIDKGTADGIEPGMGVICPQGVVGQVTSCSEHFSRITSILHSKAFVSSEILNYKLRQEGIQALGLGKWDGSNPRILKLTTIDRFKPIMKGDSVVTSEQNAIFPPKIMVGKIKDFGVGKDNAFYDIDVQLSTDFASVTYVYIVKNKLIKEQEAIENNEKETK